MKQQTYAIDPYARLPILQKANRMVANMARLVSHRVAGLLTPVLRSLFAGKSFLSQTQRLPAADVLVLAGLAARAFVPLPQSLRDMDTNISPRAAGPPRALGTPNMKTTPKRRALS
jgi:hypothetical protein